MDSDTSFALGYSMIALLVAGGFLYMTRKTSIFAPLGTLAYTGVSTVGSLAPNITTLQRWGRIVGVLIPFALMAIGPVLDLLNNNFRYTTITLVGLSSMILGFAYQTIIRGTSAYLSSLTIGTASVISYTLYDIWIQGAGYNYKALSTALGVVLMFLQLLHTVSAPVFSSSLLNDLIGTMLGSGLGLLAWGVVWNHYRSCLPNSVPVKTDKL
jgi:hypothetical protein